MEIVEVVTFRLRPEAVVERFLTENRKVQAYVASLPGFISRETAEGADGEWLVLVRWRTAEDADASVKGFGDAPENQGFIQMVDGPNMVIRRYALRGD